MKKCPKCGRENTNNSKYCEYCGESFRERNRSGNTIKAIIIAMLALALMAGGIILLIVKKDKNEPLNDNNITASEQQNVPQQEPLNEKNVSDDEKKIVREAYINILMGYGNDIKSWEGKIEEAQALGYVSSSYHLDKRQIAITDINGDGIDELLFVADTDANSNEGWEEYTEDLYVYTYREGHPVKLYQDRIYTAAAGGYTYLLVKTKGNQLVIINTATDDFEDCSVDRYSLKEGRLDREKHDGLFYVPYPVGEETMYSIEQNGTFVGVTEDEFEKKMTSLSQDFDTVLLKNGVMELSIYDIGRTQEPISMTYEEAVGEYQSNDDYGFPKGSLSYNGHHYYIYEDIDGSWDEAMQLCINRGGYLAVINDNGENEALYGYMLEMGFDSAYFGITDRDEEDKWHYIEGDDASFRDWGRNSHGTQEPNNADGGESYAMFDIHMEDGHWNDAQFGRQVYTPDGEPYENRCAYICEWGL